MSDVKFSHCYGIELEGRLRVDEGSMKKINSEISKSRNMLSNLAPLGLLAMPLKNKWLSPSTNFRRSAASTSNTRRSKNNHNSAIENFLSHMKMRGFETLTSILKYIKEQLETKHGNSILQMTIYNYELIFNNTINNVFKEKAYFDVDKEFLFINIIETADILLRDESKKMLNKIIEHHNISPANDDLRIIMETISRKNLEDKKRDFEYICSKFDICRTYPGYIDYFADFTSEILKLSDQNLKLFVDALTEVIVIEKDYIDALLDKNTVAELRDRFNILIEDNIHDVRESVSVLRGIITHRHKFIRSQHSALKIKTKAIRLLMDIIDKTFELSEEQLATEFDIITKSLRDFVAGFRVDIEMILFRFVQYTLQTVKSQWDKVAMEETKVLLEIILYGKSVNKDVHISLFTKGSNYVLENSYNPIQ